MTTRISALGSDEVYLPHNAALVSALGADLTYTNHNAVFVSALGADIVYKEAPEIRTCRARIIGL